MLSAVGLALRCVARTHTPVGKCMRSIQSVAQNGVQRHGSRLHGALRLMPVRAFRFPAIRRSHTTIRRRCRSRGKQVRVDPQRRVRILPPPAWKRLLAGAQRVRIWFTGGRPWTLDRLYGLLSVIALGTTTWIIIGTTTASSAIIVLANFSLQKLFLVIQASLTLRASRSLPDHADWN